MKITKKRFILVALFIFPLLFFLLLATGINNFTTLPVLSSGITDIKEIDSTKTLTMRNKVTVLCFLGKEMEQKKGGLFNLNQKIYKEFYGHLAFQLIAIYPKGYEVNAEKLQSQIGTFTDLSKWKFVALEEDAIINLYAKLKTNESMDDSFYSNKAYIIDKELNLRGRDDDKDSKDKILYGYNMNSVAELNNKMEDDIKVLLYEYRAAFKNKKKADRKKIEL